MKLISYRGIIDGLYIMFCRVFYIALLLTVWLFAGCKEVPTNSYAIGFSQCTGDDEWRKAMLKGMQRELAFYPQVKLLYRDAKYDSRKQVEQIKGLMQANIDLLIVSPNESAPITPIVEEAFQKGIPVVVVDRRIASPFYTAYVGANNYEVGKTAGQYIRTLLKGKGKIIEISGSPTSSPAVDRHKGLSDAMADYPGMEVVTINGDWEKKSARRALLKIIEGHTDVDLIFGHNDRMTVSAFEVCKEKGLSDKVKFVGIDALGGPLGGIQMVSDHILHATALYPTGGEEAIRTAMSILRKEPFNKENILQTAIIDTSNVRMIKMQTDKIYAQQDDIERQQQRIDDQLRIYHNQQIFLYVMTGMLAISIVFGSLALYSLVENRKINRQLNVKNEEIIEQRNKIQEMADKAQEATETKFRFFTNISHEFRTPLTLILGPLEDLLHTKNGVSSIKKNLQLIQKNAQRLLWLVNQLLDFRKIESGKIHIKATENDIVRFIHELMAPFEQVAKKREIDFRLITSLPYLKVWFDTNMVDKVFFNLLSNAFKFTSDHGRIYLYVEQVTASKSVSIKVEDTGIGMSEKDVERAFEMFYQGNNASTIGTGLGLPLSREFVELHQGSIDIVSEKGKGAIFEVLLPLGKSHLKEEEISTQEPEQIQYSSFSMDEDTNQEWIENPVNPEKVQTLLLIEDHEDLRNFLKSRLQPAFRMITAAESSQGLAEAFENIPDLIICDIMLPGMDGLKLASVLKADLRTSHIPIILLTAKSSLEQQIEGLQTGADLYITKPFSPQYLTESIRSLLTNREILRMHFTGEGPASLQPLADISKLDKKFLNGFKAAIESRLSDHTLSVDSLSREIGLSRVQLYRKVKALIGCNVNDYIGSVRLNKACNLLQQSKYTIADVAYLVGFSSATYFSTAFKAKYGISPTDYKNQKIAS